MTDKVKVTVVKAKVFHDGVSMIVLNAGKNEVEERFVNDLVKDGTIKAPKGWKDPTEQKEEPVATLDPFVTEQDDGKFNVQATWMEEAESLDDLDKANARAAEIRDAGDPALSGENDAPAA